MDGGDEAGRLKREEKPLDDESVSKAMPALPTPIPDCDMGRDTVFDESMLIQNDTAHVAC